MVGARRFVDDLGLTKQRQSIFALVKLSLLYSTTNYSNLQCARLSMIDQSDGNQFAARSQAFLKWLEEEGTTISPNIEIADLRHISAGRGVGTISRHEPRPHDAGILHADMLRSRD